jgi:hypothetical protein
MRHVLVKVVPPATLVLSGMVTSATKEALLVQSGALVGRDGSTVGDCAAAGVDWVAVAEISGEAGADVSVIAGGSVMETGAVVAGTSVAVTVAVSASACPLPQADKTSAIRAVTTNSFLIIFSLLCIYVQRST